MVLKSGVLFPTNTIGTDLQAIRDYAQMVESLGYDHLLFYEHILGVNAESVLGNGKPWSHTNAYHEPFALCGYLAAVTNSLELATCVMVLPLRDTALVAKQAATVDLLSEGRFTLGVGVGLNIVEYEAMGKDFGNRGKRIEEQIEVLRLLWTKELVTFQGHWHSIEDAGISPLPVQRPIPVWMGGSADGVLGRIGRMADGWMMPGSMRDPNEKTKKIIAKVYNHARAAGRDPREIGMQRVVSDMDSDGWYKEIRAWYDLGVTRFAVSVTEEPQVERHVEKLIQFREVTRTITN